MIKLIKGDLFTTKAQLITHGVNAQGVFGLGIAGQIAKRWPELKRRYLHKHNKEGWELGDVLFYWPEVNSKFPVIAHVCTQEFYGNDQNIVYVNYDAIKIGLEQVFKYVNDYVDNKLFAMPKIGCGLANGEWGIVDSILVELNQKYPAINVEVYYL